jgi:thiamine biosynthesis lipoprotein
MGTRWSCACYAPFALDEARVTRALEAVFDAVVADFSNWDPASFVSRFNAAPAGSHHQLPPAVEDVLSAALAVAAASEGAFNPCLGALTPFLAFVDDSGAEPISQAAEATGATEATEETGAADWTRLSVRGGMMQKPAGLQLDLSAIAKGYAVDRMGAVLAALDVPAFLVEIGGEYLGCGVKPDGLPWWVRPQATTNPPYVVALCGMAVATSGRGARVYRQAGRALHHIVAAGPDDLMSATVFHADCMTADAWATALAAAGREKALALASRHGIAALLVPLQGAPFLSPATQAMLE